MPRAGSSGANLETTGIGCNEIIFVLNERVEGSHNRAGTIFIFIVVIALSVVTVSSIMLSFLFFFSKMDDVKAINLRLYQKNQEFEKTLALKTDTVNQLETRCNRLMEVS